MSLRSRFLKFCAQADAVIGKINGAAAASGQNRRRADGGGRP